ncbi:chemotaxis protein CheW [Massilia sp. 2TAF26]|uniref:chemotaxis protein CheW n=1 Tax=Massilia sp. 2TAF26 TaxID=3233012 RepID=UPI003F9BF7EB
MTRPPQEPSGFDWAALMRQVERHRAALGALSGDDQDARAHLLRQRAQALACAPVAEDEGAADALEVLAFDCAGERYAFETCWVERTLPMQPLTALPGMPAHIVGITMVEGEVLAVLDLRVLLALAIKDLVEPGGLVVLRGEGSRFALMADALVGVHKLPASGLDHSLPALAQLDKTFLRGVAPDRTAVLDARRLLTDSTLVVHADR